MDSLLFVLKNPQQPEISEIDLIQIKSMVKQSLGEEYCNLFEYNFQIRVFDSETEMLNVFLECMNKYFHSIIGWNFVAFDWVYIYNRCVRLGIDIRKASPTFKLNDKTIKAKKKGVSICQRKPKATKNIWIWQQRSPHTKPRA